ncbi:MAG: hypothetical protein EOS70_23460 [Mesorhizobium sp.]|uniref:phage tail tape measure protein n=1 Tax=Mesorhizobium sp. TaxID=1871066 RepID=UPI000FE8CAC3|nr:phage tail tape measure protein [Mesorhizobium sp.]RWC29849.1 MAG: hypothetical protein EOS70_23460 [Mesorhizobium sp.]
MARKPIVQRISLEGGDAIKDQLKALGDAGEKAFAQIKNAAVKVEFEKLGTSLKTFGTNLATVARRATLALGLLSAAGAGAGAAMLKLAKDGAEAADQAGKAAEKTGLQVEAYGRLSFAAKQADVDQEQFIAGMSRLNKAIAEAAAEGSKAAGTLAKTGSTITEAFGRTIETFDDVGVSVTRFGSAVKKTNKYTKQTTNVFKDLGVNVKDANGRLRSTEDILGDVADAFSRLPEGPRKVALALQLFGKAGAELLPFLNQGRKGLRDLGKEAERLGIVFTNEQAEIGDALGDTLDEVSAATDGIRKQLGLIFAPAVTALAEGLRDVIVENKDAILEFGRAINEKAIGLIRDLLFALIGEDSRVRNPWILIWRDAILAFGRDVQAVVNNVVLPLFKAVRDGAQAVAEALNSIFGTNITGGELLIGAALLQLLGVFRLIASTAKVVVAALRLIGVVLATIFSEGLIASATTFFGTIIRGATTFLGFVAGLIGWPALLVAALVAAGVAVFVFWDDIVAGAQNAIAKITEFFSAANLARIFDGLVEAGKVAGALLVDAFRLAIEGIGVVLAGAAAFVSGFVEGVIGAIGGLASQLLPTWEQIGAAGAAVWDRIYLRVTAASDFIVQAVNALAPLLAPAWAILAEAGSAVWSTISTAASTAFSGVVSIVSTAVTTASDVISSLIGSVVAGFTGATSEIVDAANQIGEAITRATQAAGDVSGAEQLAQALVEPFRQAEAAINQIMVGIRTLVQNGFQSLASTVASIASQVEAAINRILSALRAAAAEAQRLRAAAGSSSSSGGSAPGLAGGGHVTGAGGPKSDSILAWLSNGEFVIQAAAVKKLGVGFLSALNNGFMPSLKSLRGFNIGGLLDGFNRSLAIPRFAGGGAVASSMARAAASTGSGKTVAVKLQYGPTLNDVIDLIGQADPVQKFYNFALGEAMSSAGRKPGRGK